MFECLRAAQAYLETLQFSHLAFTSLHSSPSVFASHPSPATPIRTPWRIWARSGWKGEASSRFATLFSDRTPPVVEKGRARNQRVWLEMSSPRGPGGTREEGTFQRSAVAHPADCSCSRSRKRRNSCDSVASVQSSRLRWGLRVRQCHTL